MLVDHARRQEHWAGRKRGREGVARAYGEYIASLAPWDWFLNPISFREGYSKAGPPAPDVAVKGIVEWFGDIQKQAGSPIGWMLGEEFGKLGGRYHCHGLITGVKELRRDFWWREAFRRFGRTRIEPFDPERGAAFYAAKYAAKQLGAVRLGGTLAGKNLDAPGQPPTDFRLGGELVTPKRGLEVAPSADLGADFFRLGLGGWHR
jgi:hypothetical protein